MTDEEWELTYERVEPHSLCCRQCKEARVERDRLEGGGVSDRIDSALKHLSMVVEERDRFRRGLVWIADRESGVWGVHARRVLYGEAA